mmetsp:Transcript_34297/g.79953  ORF Transcript_34297/g.79953 Transcript_34297/m.79953 type:complete len:289 (+) Transcript_34297:558-1424(+)
MEAVTQPATKQSADHATQASVEHDLAGSEIVEATELKIQRQESKTVPRNSTGHTLGYHDYEGRLLHDQLYHSGLLLPPGATLGVHSRSGQRIWNDRHNSGDGEEGGDTNHRVYASPAVYAGDEHPGKARGKESHSNTQSRGDRLQEPEDPAPLGFGNQVAKHGLTDRGDHRQGSTHDQPQQKVDRVVRARRNHDRDRTPKKAATGEQVSWRVELHHGAPHGKSQGKRDALSEVEHGKLRWTHLELVGESTEGGRQQGLVRSIDGTGKDHNISHLDRNGRRTCDGRHGI